MLSNEIISSEVSEIRFGLYSDDELRALSVCKIDSPLAFDSLGNALKGGLYDAAMGPQSQASPPCRTCGSIYMHCPGHCGRIELCVPVYHPLLFKSLYFLLKAKCGHCHRFRMSRAKVRQYLVKLKLVEMGELAEVERLDSICLPSAVFDGKDGVPKPDLEDVMHMHEERYEAFLRTNKDRSVDTRTSMELNNMVEAFKRAISSIRKCENCKAYSPSLRKDGYAKVFEKPLQQKMAATNANLEMKLKSALEEMGSEKRSSAADMEEDGVTSEDEIDSSSDAESEEEEDVPQKRGKPAIARPTKVEAKAAAAAASSADKYLAPIEVEARMKLLWRMQGEVLDFIWTRALMRKKNLHANHRALKEAASKQENVNEVNVVDGGSASDAWKMFFMRCVLVPPSRFRPAADMGEMKVEHAQNITLAKVLQNNEKIRNLMAGPGSSTNVAIDEAAMKKVDMSRLVTTWIDLQNEVNCYMDSAKDPNPLGSSAAPPGIRQLLERKEGLFRKNMMGKRVNFCCRSVISPDPFIGTNEVGIPVIFAKELHFPAPVTDWNVKYLRKLVENGPNVYPGANEIEYPNGKVVKLDRFTAQQRAAQAKLLLSTPGMKVSRHLIDGDMLLVNRQPTLHKPGIMAHKARVLQHVKEQTIRMHYANCNSYNADFDGDEINCHFVQNEIARAEAATICNNDNQYIVPTSGTPLRGLIQDHVAGGVKLTQRDTFLTKEEFQQLLFVAVSGLPGTEVVSPNDEIIVPHPAILKPKSMWTGKQVISSLINHLCKPPLPPLHLDGKARTPPQAFGASNNEHIIVFRYGELLCGVMDKAAVGNTSMSIVHAIYELYGAELAGKLLTAFGRLFTYYLQAFAAMTCGIEDLTLRPSAEKERTQLLNKVGSAARVGLLSFLRSNDVHHGGDSGPGDIKKDDLTPEECMESAELLGNLMLSEPRTGKPKIDAHLQSVVNKVASDVIKACLPNGLESMFPKNNFSMMVSTGAKGSAVNQSQISCFLGQQALEGQRVPVMISGKTLPSFRAYDGTARAGGFISDRFLTGVKPQEYYFHCMAGREGLVDTAVKTSRSGYLQRCLVKHLEELQVNYDYTVRDSGGNVIQFLYGEDGLDTLTASMLGGSGAQMQFLARNHEALMHKYGINEGFLEQGMDTESADAHRALLRNGDKFAKAVGKLEKKTGAGFKLAPAGAAIEEALSKKCVVMARRKINPELGWSRANMQASWSPAEIVKVRKSEDGSSHVAVDLKYGDGVVEKKVPLFIRVKNKENRGPIKVEHVYDSDATFEITPLLDDKGVFMPLIRSGLPDPAMSTLALGNTVGAISEKLQKDIDDYVNKNPDKAISTEVSDTTVTAKALEFLVSVKYMRGLACPGEAVGCVAAQSIGEPSTQMTLNTFHLAGHGGANVTLGIPRLREIIMTASKTLKTPTMMLPLLDSKTMNEAKEISRKLSKLCMNELIHHKKGVEVRESIKQGDGGSWLRHYKVRFYFESPEKIHLAFGIKFDDLVDCVKNKLISVLRALINREIRRSGEKNKSASLVGSFKEKPTLSRGNGEDDEEGEENPREPKSRDGLDEDGGSDDEEDLEADDDSVDGAEALKAKAGKKAGGDAVEYEEDEEGDDEEEEDNGANNDDVSDNGSGDEGNNSDEDAPKASKKQGAKKSSVAETPKKADAKGKASAKTPSSEAADKKKRGPVVVNEKDFMWSEEQGWVEIDLRFLASARRLLMLQLAEQAAKISPVRITKNIARAHVVHCENEAGVVEAGIGIMTEGVNFEEAWSLPDDLIRHADIRSNDINAMLLMYGVEAARESIVSEVKGVFGVYGINVNPRHLGLIADFMTRNGEYTPMNRAGMWYCPSPLQQMSFETTCTFLTQAAQDGSRDVLESPSARIVTGSAPRVGTGSFELLFPLA